MNISNKYFHNFGLKFVLWLPYIITLLYFGIGNIVIMAVYDIPLSGIYYIGTYIIGYSMLMNFSEHIRRKYWGLTQCKDS